MDLGESINPAIDIGQIEGGFTQGLGLLTLEEPMFAPNGFIVTRGPSNYKIPTADDMPVEFNVSLLRGCPNPRAVFSSKVRNTILSTVALFTTLFVKDCFLLEFIYILFMYRL